MSIMTSNGSDIFERTRYQVGNIIYTNYEDALCASIRENKGTCGSNCITTFRDYCYDSRTRI